MIDFVSRAAAENWSKGEFGFDPFVNQAFAYRQTLCVEPVQPLTLGMPSAKSTVAYAQATLPNEPQPDTIKDLCARLLESLPETGCLLIEAHGIWPSSEDLAAFDKLRRSLGCLCDINTCPGHIYESTDSTAMASILFLAMKNVWDVAIACPAKMALFRSSHDEVAVASGQNKAIVDILTGVCLDHGYSLL